MRTVRSIGFLGLLIALPSNCGSNNDNAAGCSSQYALGCVGDGRQASSATPGRYSTTSCASSEYSYFKLNMTVPSPSIRPQVNTCTLNITDSKGNLIEAYTLPSVEAAAAGGTQGCLGLASSLIGYLSYSSCCASSETMQFTLLLKDSNDAVLATASASGPCSKSRDPSTMEVSLDLSAK